ncbi:MAG: hypothetical protein LQ339_006672 [Xanthoria mediterranea]|nr:MAG: hypothetical protein LQ339_006672 [Xanthoria mediterranea]
MSTERASTSPSSRERDIHHLECRRKGIRIHEAMFPTNRDNNDPLSDDLESDLGLAWQIIEDENATQQPAPDHSAQAETIKTRYELATQAKPSALPASTRLQPETAKALIQHINRPTDVAGVSIFGAAILYLLFPETAKSVKNLTSWIASILTRPKLTRQFFFTAFFMLVPLWIGVFKAINGILHWIFLLVENNRLNKAIQICTESIRQLDVGIAQSKEIIALQNELMELKQRQRDLLEKERAKKNKSLNKKKRSSGVKKEDLEKKAW